MKNKKKILLIIDPQNDFVSGSLMVPDALEKMNSLRDFIEEHGKEFDEVVITLDWHPINHCSFVKNGGKWPEHCVKFTNGAMPEPGLIRTILETFPNNNIQVIYKGMSPGREEYGAFEDPVQRSVLLPERDIYSERKANITVTGIMSEYCVVESLKGILRDEFYATSENITLWLPGISTMDDHKTLLGFAKEKGITKIIKD